MLIRFDDICINSNMESANSMAEYARSCGHTVWYCVSPLVNDLSGEQGPTAERVFAGILKAYSDPRVFYRVDKCGIPALPDGVTVCSHGLVHVDHRLLGYAAQEMSIVVSCALLKSRMFVPPFNKWNADTEAICKDHDIGLAKFEHGWLSMEHNTYDGEHRQWYLHPREWTVEQFIGWFK